MMRSEAEQASNKYMVQFQHRAWSSDRVIDHDCALGLLEHDPVIEEWVTYEYRVACHFYHYY